ncbi:hypothetical protein SHO565_31880 [Streptomyces sp. HO565]
MTGYGVASCPQGLLSFYADTVRDRLGVGEGKLLVGISFGYADENAPVIRVATGRAALEDHHIPHLESAPKALVTATRSLCRCLGADSTPDLLPATAAGADARPGTRGRFCAR